VYEAAHRVGGDHAEQPQHEKNDQDRPEHHSPPVPASLVPQPSHQEFVVHEIPSFLERISPSLPSPGSLTLSLPGVNDANTSAEFGRLRIADSRSRRRPRPEPSPWALKRFMAIRSEPPPLGGRDSATRPV
jgi:hypothetical protein